MWAFLMLNIVMIITYFGLGVEFVNIFKYNPSDNSWYTCGKGEGMETTG